ncbi:MAG: putative sensor protein [Holophagaceae bacterium]|nr:putative sensor protein [Holophagaceae bacterium]
MIEVHKEDIDRLTEVFAHILGGKRPERLELPPGHPDNEFRQVVEYVNRFVESYNETAELSYQLARGELNAEPPRGRNVVLQSLKSLHASLRTLTWTTQQIARGDFSQKVNFMGDFSEAFNRMTEQLRQSFEEQERAARRLQEQVDELARTRRAMLNIMEDLKSPR